MGLGAANIYGMGGGFGGNFSTGQAANAIFGGNRKRAEGGPVGGGLDSLPIVQRQYAGSLGGNSSPLSTTGKPYSIDEDRRPVYEKLSEKLMDPTTTPQERTQIISDLTSGRMSFTGPSQADTRARNIKREGELKNINTTADNDRVEANKKGLTALKKCYRYRC